jgi:hypothetical protein
MGETEGLSLNLVNVNRKANWYLVSIGRSSSGLGNYAITGFDSGVNLNPELNCMSSL